MLIGIAIIFFIILFLFIFGGNKEEEANGGMSTEDSSEQDIEDGLNVTEDNDDHTSSSDLPSDHLPEETIVQQINSDDPNVIAAFVGDWPIIKTSQEEPHTTNYEDNSEDRKEIKEAILFVTDIDEAHLIEHWVGNGGEQKVIATVEDQSNETYFRIYLSWIENNGWQVTLVEQIKDIDNL